MREHQLTADQIGEFNDKGMLLLKGFYDVDREIEPIQFGIYKIVGLVIKRHRLSIPQQPFTPETFDSGYQELIAAERSYGGEIYDAVKQIPAFVRIVAAERNERLFSQLRNTDTPGIAAGGYGIRIDNPQEEQFRAPWHQEYPAQLRSRDGIVFWSPLVRVTPELGPVEVCIGSHNEGLLRVRTQDPRNPGKKGAYALILENEEGLVSRYPRAAPLTAPGDLMLIDFLTLHTSGFNRANRPRWAMQLRYFNFRDPTGVRIGWSGSFAAGVDFKLIHPELVAD